MSETIQALKRQHSRWEETYTWVFRKEIEAVGLGKGFHFAEDCSMFEKICGENFMSEKPKFYERTLDSFADHIITRARPYDGGWHAVLDCGFRTNVSDPDFSTHGYGRTKEEAQAKSAAAIRADAVGVGKYAPHSLLVPGYDLHWRLMRHWDMKERFEVAGLDPNDMYYQSAAAINDDEGGWKLSGEYLSVMTEKRLLEFKFRLHIAEVMAEVAIGNVDPSEVRNQVVARVEETLNDAAWRTRATAQTWATLEGRIEEYCFENGLRPVLAI